MEKLFKCDISVYKPDEVICELYARFSLGDWKKIRASFGNKYVSDAVDDFANNISDLVTKVERQFVPKL